MNIYDELKSRGIIGQTTHDDEIRNLFANKKVTFYIGFDPTADSLHVGHFLTIMAMARLARAGHRPIALIGGGTAMIGDPTDKTDMRRIMTRDEVEYNASRFKSQLGKFLDFGDDGAVMVNNADWLMNLNYIDFLRNVGVHFSVNRMLTADCYRTRLEKGLTFLEFNYMLMQSYDFLELYRRHGCTMQLGGNDQWSNIIGGIELIRRVENASAFGMTFTLLTTSTGKKMGKTESGAVWLDPEKTPPHDFFQYWRNIDDADVKRCLYLLTFLPPEEIEDITGEGSNINAAKEKLAFELTNAVHGQDEAIKARDAARALFGGQGDANAPTTIVKAENIGDGISVIDAFVIAGLCSSKSDARRLITQGGANVSGVVVKDPDTIIKAEDIAAGVLLRKGKKYFQKIIIG